MPSQKLKELWPGLVVEPNESRAVEYKASMPWEDIKYSIARAALGLANHRDGGVIVVGVRTIAGDRLEATGMDPETLASYQQDDVHDFINKFAQTSMNLNAEVLEYEGSQFYVIEVGQFAAIPVISKKSSPPEHQGAGVRKDTIYARPSGKVETRPATAEDLQEILELAADVALRRYLERARRVGINVTAGQPVDGEFYQRERGDL
jgi:hypothetical protein